MNYFERKSYAEIDYNIFWALYKAKFHENIPEFILAVKKLKLQICASSISRAFTNTYGKSFYQYVKARRLTVAAQALAETKKPIIEVAYEAHYSSQQAFTLAFHQVYQCTPQEYRKKGIFSPKQLRLAIHTTKSKKGYPINKSYLFIQKGEMAG